MKQALPFLQSPFRDGPLQFIQSMGQQFGENPELYAQFGIKGHNGIDIPKNLGTLVYSSQDGIVTRLQISQSQGNGIWILDEHARQWLHPTYFRTSYWHLEKFVNGLKVGDKVMKGQLIGYVDSTGFSTGHHLHWGLCPFVDFGSVKLFPDNGYDGYIDPFKFLEGYSHDSNREIGGTSEINNMLKLVIKDTEQYIRGKDGKDYHIYNLATLNAAFSAGIISSLIPEVVQSINDSGKDFVVLMQE